MAKERMVVPNDKMKVIILGRLISFLFLSFFFGLVNYEIDLSFSLLFFPFLNLPRRVFHHVFVYSES